MQTALRLGGSVLALFGGLIAIRWATSHLLVCDSLTWVDIARLFTIGFPLLSTACFLTLIMELYLMIGSERRR